jgi:hypothetical protein
MDEAYARVKALRPIIAPNLVFVNQLNDFENLLKKNNEKQLQQQISVPLINQNENENENNDNLKISNSFCISEVKIGTNNSSTPCCMKNKETHNKLNIRSSISSETESESSDSSVGMTSSLPSDYLSSNSSSNSANISTTNSLNPFLH